MNKSVSVLFVVTEIIRVSTIPLECMDRISANLSIFLCYKKKILNEEMHFFKLLRNTKYDT